MLLLLRRVDFSSTWAGCYFYIGELVLIQTDFPHECGISVARTLGWPSDQLLLHLLSPRSVVLTWLALIVVTRAPKYFIFCASLQQCFASAYSIPRLFGTLCQIILPFTWQFEPAALKLIVSPYWPGPATAQVTLIQPRDLNLDYLINLGSKQKYIFDEIIITPGNSSDQSSAGQCASCFFGNQIVSNIAFSARQISN